MVAQLPVIRQLNGPNVDLVGYGSKLLRRNCSCTHLTIQLLHTMLNGCQRLMRTVRISQTELPTRVIQPPPLNPCSVPPVPTLSIDDVSADEGDSGTTSFDFTVSLSAPADTGGVTFDIATADDTATVADNDYIANSLTGQTIPEDGSSYTFSVLVNGDTVPEPDETFFVNVTNVIGATLGDGQGQGTILDDDTDFCALVHTPIYEIQGSGDSAAITGNVTTQGVVVGDFEGTTGLQGFYLQDLTGDGNVETSDGIFVFTGSANLVSAGQVVRVTGFARERFDQTALQRFEQQLFSGNGHHRLWNRKCRPRRCDNAF
jgi:uncharacterized protein